MPPLSITRHLCELMGAGITVTSTLGEGSVFSLELPVQRVDAASGAHRRSRVPA